MLVIVGLLGLSFGSFVNAAVWRLHEQARAKKQGAGSREQAKGKSKSSYQLPATSYSVLKGRSMCPKCKHTLAAWDLVPLFSWLWLRGKCRYCKKPISVQYPIVEALTAALFTWSYLAWEFNGVVTYLNFGFWLTLLTGLLILAAYDLRWMILPDRVLKPLFWLTMINLVAITLLNQSFGVISSHFLAAASAGAFFFSLHWLGKGRWMGGGDVKLAILMGLILGTTNSIVAFFLGFNLAALYSLTLIVTRKLSRKDLIPFGPFLIAATIIAKLHGQDLFHAYVDFFLTY